MSSEAPQAVVYREREARELPLLAPFLARVLEEELDVRAGDDCARAAEAFAATFDPRRDVLVTAEAGGKTVGILLVVPGGGTGELADFRWLAVLGASQGIGIGRELLFRGIEACRERGRRLLRAYAFAVSPAACRLYWLYGFRVAGLEAFPVGDAVRERIVFEKRLEPPAG